MRSKLSKKDTTCETGLLGECAKGVYECVELPSKELSLTCKPVELSVEVCYGIDNDCV